MSFRGRGGAGTAINLRFDHSSDEEQAHDAPDVTTIVAPPQAAAATVTTTVPTTAPLPAAPTAAPQDRSVIPPQGTFDTCPFTARDLAAFCVTLTGTCPNCGISVVKHAIRDSAKPPAPTPATDAAAFLARDADERANPYKKVVREFVARYLHYESEVQYEIARKAHSEAIAAAIAEKALPIEWVVEINLALFHTERGKRILGSFLSSSPEFVEKRVKANNLLVLEAMPEEWRTTNGDRLLACAAPLWFPADPKIKLINELILSEYTTVSGGGPRPVAAIRGRRVFDVVGGGHDYWLNVVRNPETGELMADAEQIGHYSERVDAKIEQIEAKMSAAQKSLGTRIKQHLQAQGRGNNNNNGGNNNNNYGNYNNNNNNNRGNSNSNRGNYNNNYDNGGNQGRGRGARGGAARGGRGRPTRRGGGGDEDEIDGGEENIGWIPDEKWAALSPTDRASVVEAREALAAASSAAAAAEEHLRNFC